MGNSIKGGKKQYKADSGIYHFLYIYIDETEDNNELSSITKVLLNTIVPNIPNLKNNEIYVEIFQINKHTLKNKELIKLLKKNNILKLPALKIYNGSEHMLIIGANQIIEYYNKYLGLSINMPLSSTANMQPPNKNIQLSPNRNINPPTSNININSISNRRPPPLLNRTPFINDDEDDDLPIGSNKNMTSRLDEMLKFREMTKKEYKNNDNSQISNGNRHTSSNHASSNHASSNHASSNHASSSHASSSHKKNTHKKKYKSTITEEDLKDSPFKEDEFLNDGLDDNLDDDLDNNFSSYTSSLLSSTSNSKTNSYSNMGDDEADDEKDELMIRAFWNNNFND
jgi:hypothetical protein